MRGGSWNNTAQNCRAAYRNNDTPDDRWHNNGFRLVLAPQLDGTTGWFPLNRRLSRTCATARGKKTGSPCPGGANE